MELREKSKKKKPVWNWAEFVISVTRTDGSDRLLPSCCYDLLWFSFIHHPHPPPAPLRSLSKGQLWRYAI